MKIHILELRLKCVNSKSRSHLSRSDAFRMRDEYNKKSQ